MKKNRKILRGRVQVPTGGKVRDLPGNRWLNWCDSGTDSIVWMREESFDRKSDRVIADRFLRENQSSPGSYFGGIFTLQEM